MFCALSYKPHKHMAVKHHVFEVKFLLVLVLVDECCLELSFLSELELFDLDLLGKIHSVLRHSLEDGFLGSPVDCQLLVRLLVLKVLYLNL